MPEVVEFRSAPKPEILDKREMRNRRRALAIIEQLPEDIQDAMRVLDLARELMAGWVQEPKPASQ